MKKILIVLVLVIILSTLASNVFAQQSGGCTALAKEIDISIKEFDSASDEIAKSELVVKIHMLQQKLYSCIKDSQQKTTNSQPPTIQTTINTVNDRLQNFWYSFFDRNENAALQSVTCDVIPEVLNQLRQVLNKIDMENNLKIARITVWITKLNEKLKNPPCNEEPPQETSWDQVVKLKCSCGEIEKKGFTKLGDVGIECEYHVYDRESDYLDKQHDLSSWDTDKSESFNTMKAGKYANGFIVRGIQEGQKEICSCNPSQPEQKEFVFTKNDLLNEENEEGNFDTTEVETARNKIAQQMITLGNPKCEGKETGFRTPTLIPQDNLPKPETQVATTVGLSNDLMPDPSEVAFCVSNNKEREDIKKKIASLEEKVAEMRSLSVQTNSITTAVTAAITGLQTAPLTLEEIQRQLRQFNEQIEALTKQQTALQQQNCGREAFTFSHDLKIGVSGNEVTNLQNYLKTRGFYNDPTTTYFGPQTQEAVRKFQQKYGLTTTGVLGPLTRAKINELAANQNNQLGANLANTLTPTVAVSADISSSEKSYCKEYVDGRVEVGLKTNQGMSVKIFPICLDGQTALKATCIREGQSVAEIKSIPCDKGQYCLDGVCNDRPDSSSTGVIKITCPSNGNKDIIITGINIYVGSDKKNVVKLKMFDKDQEVCSCTSGTVTEQNPVYDQLARFVTVSDSNKEYVIKSSVIGNTEPPSQEINTVISPEIKRIIEQMTNLITSSQGKCKARPTTGTTGPGYISIIGSTPEYYPKCENLVSGVRITYSARPGDFSFTPSTSSLCYACPPNPLTVNGVVRDPVQVECGQRPETGTPTQTGPVDWTSSAIPGACDLVQIQKGCRTAISPTIGNTVCNCPPTTGPSQPVDTNPGAVCPADCRDMGESDGKRLCNCCGNGKIDSNTASNNYLTVYEACDGNNFGGATCATEKGSGYEGSLSCITCQTIVSSACAKRPETGQSACGTVSSTSYLSWVSANTNDPFAGSWETVTANCVTAAANGNQIPYTDGRYCFSGCDDVNNCLGCVMRIVSPPLCNWETGVCDPNPADDTLRTDPSWSGVQVADAGTGTGGTEGTGSGSGGSGIIAPAVVYSRNYCYLGVFWNPRTGRMECI
ncbi:peptidoglycan-binding protein [Candidatus Woesearchaeota archaeon]|nr:peptidoglycan-binding protein [Candidatus Woesearchaeota archaeon]